MNILKAENRNKGLKAKSLRKAGIIPGCIYGKDLEESLLVQIPQREVIRLLKTKAKGSRLIVEVDNKRFNVLLKDISYSLMDNQIEHLGFQSLVAGEMVTSTARIVLVNREKIPNFIQQLMFEIPYKALPSNLVEKVTIDLEGLKAGSCIKVEDLEIAGNKDIELLTEPESIVLNIVDKGRSKQALPAAGGDEQE